MINDQLSCDKVRNDVQCTHLSLGIQFVRKSREMEN